MTYMLWDKCKTSYANLLWILKLGSLIDARIFHKIASPLNITPCQLIYSSISGQGRPVPYFIILGSDFMEQYCTILDYGKFKFWHDAIPFYVRGQENIIRVQATHNVQVPPCHQQIMWIKLYEMMDRRIDRKHNLGN